MVRFYSFLLNFTLPGLKQNSPRLVASGSESSFSLQRQSKEDLKVLAIQTHEQLWFQSSLWAVTEPGLQFTLTLYPALSLPLTLTLPQGASQKSILDFEHDLKGCFPEKLT